MSPSAAAAVFPQTLPRRTSRDRDWPRFRSVSAKLLRYFEVSADAMPPEAIAAGRMAPCFLSVYFGVAFVIKPRTPPGVLELLPREQIAFQRMLDVIRRNYERFGFLPVETPVFELSDVLLTKSGGETERQVYFVQSTGTLANAAESGATRLPELALRFDLTVPLARYVAEYEHVLAFPFRRYQIQRVYRGERAQRGRFREFYQCDIDVIGKQTLSIRYDAEVLAVIHAVFSGVGDRRFPSPVKQPQSIAGLP